MEKKLNILTNLVKLTKFYLNKLAQKILTKNINRLIIIKSIIITTLPDLNKILKNMEKESSKI